MMTKLQKRAYNFALNIFPLREFWDSGVKIEITDKLRAHVRANLSEAWRAGYSAGRAAAKEGK